MANNTNLVARIILRLQDEASRGLDNARQHVGGIGQEIGRVKQLLIGLFSFIAIKEGLEKLVVLSDKFSNLSARIKLSTSSTQEYNSAQSELFNIAQRSRTALDMVVALYAKMQIGIKALGGSQKMAFDATEAVTRAFKISGATTAEAGAAIQQFTQSIASGVFRGEEFNSVMEQGPRLAQALADGLGVPISALRKMAEAGELTSDRVIAALLSQKDKLAAEYALLPQTVAGAWQQLENQFLLYIGKSKDAKAATQNIADGIGYVTEHLNTFINTAVTSGQVIIGIFAARKFAGLADFADALVLARAELRATEIVGVQAAINTQRAAAATAASLSVGAEAATAAIARGAVTAEAAAEAAAAAGIAASRAATVAGATSVQASVIAGAAAGQAATAAGATAEQAASAAGSAARAAGASAAEASAIAAQASGEAMAANLAATEAALASSATVATARIAEATAAQSAIAVAKEEAAAKLAVAEATIASTEATIAQLESTASSAFRANALASANERLIFTQWELSAAESRLIVLAERETAAAVELTAAQNALRVATEAQLGADIRAADARAALGNAALAERRALAEMASAELAASTAAAQARERELVATRRLMESDRAAAQAKLAAAEATIASTEATIASLSATVRSASVVAMLRAETVRLTEAQLVRAEAEEALTFIANEEAIAENELAAARQRLAAATDTVARANTRLAETSALAAGANGGLGRALGEAGAGLSRLVGGPLGVAVLGFYALYEGVQKLTGAEEKAAVKSKALADALALMHTEVKDLSGAEIDIDLSKTNAGIDGLEQKISDLGWSRIWTVGFHGVMEINKQIDNLEQNLDVLKQRKDALTAKKNEDIINFDSSKLSAEELNAELVATKAKIAEIHQRVDPLKKQLEAGLIGSEAVNDDLKLLNAYESKFEQLAKKSSDSSFEAYQLRQSLNTIPEAANALAQGVDTALASAKKAAIQHANELIETAKDSAGKTHKPYDEAAKAITKSFEDSTQAIDTELKQQLDAIKINAANEEVEIDATAQAFRDAERDKTAAAENTKTDLERVWNETYGTAIELTRNAGGNIEQLEKDGAEARIAALQTVVDAYQSSISTMIDEEHRLLAEIKATDEYRLNIQTSIEDKIRESQRKTLSDEAAYADEHNQIYEKLAQADSLRRHGELDAARKTEEEALRLADSHDRVLKDASDKAVKRAMEAEAKAKASADKVAEYSFAGGNADEKRMAAQAKRIDAAADKVAAAHEKVIEAQRKQAEEQEAQERRHIETATLYQKILESLDATAAQRQEKLQGAADGFFGDIDGTKKKLSALKDMIQGIQDQVSKKSDIKLKLGADEALKDIEKLKALLAAKELAVKIKADPANADKEVAELTQRLKNANVSVPAAIAFEQIRNEEINKVTEPLDKALSEPHTVKVNADDAVKKAGDVGQAVTAATQPRKLTILTAEAEAEMNRMLAEIAKTKEPQQIQVDAADASGKVAALSDQVAAIPKNTITRLDADGNPLSTTILKTKAELEGLSSKNTITRLDADGNPLSTKIIGAKGELDGLKNTAPIVIDADVEKARAKIDEFRDKYARMSSELREQLAKIEYVSPDINTEKANEQISEFEVKANDLLNAVGLGLNTTTASTELDRLKADVDAKLSAPTEAVHKVNPDFTEVFNDINQIKQPTSSTHTVYVQEIQQHANGGPIRFMATGGPVSGPGFRRVTGAISGPGTGTSDEVPIMGSNGEFMMKEAAVSYYGDAFMNAVNNREFPRLQNYATGGPIANSPAAAPANMPTPQMDTINLVFHFGPKAIPVQTSRSLARDLAVELRSLARAS